MGGAVLCMPWMLWVRMLYARVREACCSMLCMCANTTAAWPSPAGGEADPGRPQRPDPGAAGLRGRRGSGAQGQLGAAAVQPWRGAGRGAGALRGCRGPGVWRRVGRRVGRRPPARLLRPAEPAGMQSRACSGACGLGQLHCIAVWLEWQVFAARVLACCSFRGWRIVLPRG